VLGFFQITVELLDQALGRGRVAFACRSTITVVLSLVLPHPTPFLLFHTTPDFAEGLISLQKQIRVVQTMELRVTVYMHLLIVAHPRNIQMCVRPIR
jgi:hypothetical protein